MSSSQWQLRHLHSDTNYAFLTDKSASTMEYPVGRKDQFPAWLDSLVLFQVSLDCDEP